MEVLHQRDNEKFTVDRTVNYKYLSPIGDFVQWKLENEHWDDYNELYHVTRLIEDIKKEQGIWIEIHSIIRNEDVMGVLLILGGEIKAFESKYEIEKENLSLLLKYFHVVDKGKGFGSYWLKSVVFPHYRERGYQQIYVNSSHQDSFPFYERLGSLITAYQQISDNRLYLREGNCFLIRL